MDQTTRNNLQSATQQARRLLERDIAEQLEGTFDVMPEGAIADKPGQHLDSMQRLTRTKLVEAIHHRAADSSDGSVLAAAVADYTREAAFTILNRYVALKMLEARGLVQQCVTKGDQSSGFKEFYLAAPGLLQLPDKGYRLYLECLFDELSTEVKILFDRHDAASLLWPRRQAFDALLALLNADDIASVWKEDETIGWVYQYFNSQEERRKMRDESQAPRNSRELAVRNQFFTPRYVVEFLTDNTLGRTWYEMRQGTTRLTEQCRYLVRRPIEIFLGDAQLAGEGLLGKPDDPEGREIPATVAAAFRGDLANALKEEVGSYQWWIGLAIPVDQWAKIIGREPSQLADESLLNDVLDGLRNNPDSPVLQDPLRIWCALGHMALTSSGGPYAIEPSRLLWEGLKRAYEADSKLDRSQEEMLRQPVLIAFRPKKDPRDLKILDPACGSSHFLLYCFDLLLTIYEEAWHDAYSPPALDVPGPDGESPARTLREDYPTLEKLREALPGLILRHNLHGIDIDPRCAQIGAFALWMRAQRAYNDFNLPKDQRPQIRRSNIVVAEPMPGEEDLFEEFLRNLKEDRLESLIHEALNVPADRKITATKAMAESLCALVRTIWNTMKLAGEAGSLLRIDKELENAIAKGRAEWEQKLPLFRLTEYDMGGTGKTSLLKALPGEEGDFWTKSEMLVHHALRRFAADGAQTGNATFRRGLFAEDAKQGLAFIDLCRVRLDVVLMNPPFGAASTGGKKYIDKAYPQTKNDIYGAFVERGVQWLHSRGVLGAITSRSGLFLSSFQKWRENVLIKVAPPKVLADLGYGVLDAAMVEVAAYCLEKASAGGGTTTFIRMLETENKAAGLRELINSLLGAPNSQTFVVNTGSFSVIPRSPFAYWVSARVRRLFTELNPFDDDTRTAKQGLATADDFRFVRCWWEVDDDELGSRWLPLAKGGAYSPFYADVFLIVNWHSNGAEIRNFCKTGTSRLASRPQNTEYFMRPGITWPLRTQIGLAMRAMPQGCVFGHKGPAAFIVNDNGDDLLALLCVVNSGAFRGLVDVQMAFGAFEVGVIQRTPIPGLNSFDRDSLASLGRKAWSLKRSVDTSVETSHAFSLPAMLQVDGETFTHRLDSWSQHVLTLKQALATIQDRINTECFGLYDVGGEDRRSITETLTKVGDLEMDGAESEQEDEGAGDSDGDETSEVSADDLTLASQLISWAVGVVVGRVDVSFATRSRAVACEPEPFAPLAVCPPGMLTGDDGLQLASAPPSYLITFPENGILVDDPGHPRDLTAAVRAVFDLVFPGRADEWWRDVGAVLDPKGNDIRIWLTGDFFEFHIKGYSKSRRKAPIYWRLGTPSGRYSVWLYVHRATGDTLFRVLNDFVVPKISHEEQVYGRLLAEAGGSPTNSQRKAIEEQQDLVGELKAFADELRIVAPLWQPNLDDGVIINFAPLWRLVPHHKAWQKECKACWDSLCGEEYDWSHLAMHLWPQRVVPKCAEDASLAIAHGLDDLFWVKEAGRWRRLGTPDDEIKRQKEPRVSPTRDRIRAGLEKLCTGDAGKRSCTAVWQALSNGAMDDAPLALALWPQRVIEGCRASVALASAHGFKKSDLTTQRAADNLQRRYEDPDLDDLRQSLGTLLLNRTDSIAATWQALQRGDLDQQRTALELWPERVIDKCLKDLKLAEQHGLRVYFWYESPDHGWRRRRSPKEEIALETTRRHNPSVQSALATLLAAPVPGGGKRGDRRTRPAASSAGRSADAAKPKRRGKKAKGGDASAAEELL